MILAVCITEAIYTIYGAIKYCGVMLSYEVCKYQVWWKSKMGVIFLC